MNVKTFYKFIVIKNPTQIHMYLTFTFLSFNLQSTFNFNECIT